MDEKSKSVFARLWKVLRFFLAFGLVVLVWSASIFLVTHSGSITRNGFASAVRMALVGHPVQVPNGTYVDPRVSQPSSAPHIDTGSSKVHDSSSAPDPNNATGDLTTLLFGAASVALFLFSIIVGALAVIGWQAVERHIDHKIEEGIGEKTKKLEDEMKGRVYSALGHMLGEMSIERLTLKVKDEEQLEEAIETCRAGQKFLDEAGEPAEFMGLNNLIFYSCLRGISDHGKLLKDARRMKDSAGKHSGAGAANALITSCRAIIQFSSDREEVLGARQDLEDILKTSLPEKLKREARIHLGSPSKIDKIS
jgi:hypothetical protein